MPQQVVHVPQIERNVSLLVSPHAVIQHIPEHVVQQMPQQQVSQYQIPQQVAQSPQQIAQFPQTVGAGGGIGENAGVGVVVGRAPGALPKPGNPFYIPRADNPDRILSRTPPAHAQHVHRTLNVSPINLQTPPGFVYPQHEQGSNQAQNTRLNRNSENNRAQVSQNRNPQDTQNGLRAPPRNRHVNTSEQFKPIKGTKYLPMSFSGCILTTRKEKNSFGNVA